MESNAALERCGITERIDHRTLEAQRIEALELSSAAEVRGDEAEALQQTVRAVALDRPPLPQLSAGAWQLKERGQEVAAVRVWHEVKAHAAEVARVAQELAGHVRTWLERAAERVLDKMQPPEQGLAYAGGGDSQERGQDLAARMREAWAARQSQTEAHENPKPELEAGSLADRLREAAAGIDPEKDAARTAVWGQDREAKALKQEQDRQAQHQREQELQRLQAQEIQSKLERQSERDLGDDYEL